MKTTIVGGGIGGVSAALLASLRGDEVDLFEAHEVLGGCASYFKAGPYIFDVGATTISGVGPTQPLGKLFSQISKTPTLLKVDPGIVFYLSSGKKLRYFCDELKWMNELKAAFPHLDHAPFWRRVYEVAKSGWTFLGEVKKINFAPFYPKHYHLLASLAVSTEMMLKNYGLNDPDYRELIDGILLISAQTTASETSFLVGAMGLSYPSDTYVMKGGMKGLFDFLEGELIQRNVKVFKNDRVIKIVSAQNKYVIKSLSGKNILSDQVILNLPIWNQAELFEQENQSGFTTEAINRPGFWGAFTMYLGVSGKIQDLFHQIHLNHPEVKNYFVSFSHPSDDTRSPENHQTVTISTHTDAKSWSELSRDMYLERKKKITELILSDFKKRFPVLEVKLCVSGTPKTFERFTLRQNGFVGGLPYLYGQNPFSLLNFSTSLPHIYRVGDTQFPGQGLTAVVAGSLNLHHELKT